MINQIIFIHILIFKCLICDLRSLKCVLGYGLGGFSVVCGCFVGVSTDTLQKGDKLYACLREASGKSNGTEL